MKKKELVLKKLGQNIRRLRLESGLSQTKLANKVGKDQQSIQRLEAGKINPSYYYLCEIAEGLDTNFKQLIEF